MLKLKVGYPDRQEERAIIDRMTSGHLPQATAVIKPETIVAARSVVNSVYVDEKIKDYIVDLVFASRQPEDYGLQDLKGLIAFGASPRASIYLTVASRAHAFLRRRGYVTPEDVKTIGLDVLRHRIITTYEAEAEEITPEDIVGQIFDTIEVP